MDEMVFDRHQLEDMYYAQLTRPDEGNEVERDQCIIDYVKMCDMQGYEGLDVLLPAVKFINYLFPPLRDNNVVRHKYFTQTLVGGDVYRMLQNSDAICTAA